MNEITHNTKLKSNKPLFAVVGCVESKGDDLEG